VLIELVADEGIERTRNKKRGESLTGDDDKLSLFRDLVLKTNRFDSGSVRRSPAQTNKGKKKRKEVCKKYGEEVDDDAVFTCSRNLVCKNNSARFWC
jgi:hypothetical protein